jgi:hypothetical protein
VKLHNGAWIFADGSFGWQSVTRVGLGEFCVTTTAALGAGRVLLVEPVAQNALTHVTTNTTGCDHAGQFEVSITSPGGFGLDGWFYAVAIAPQST